MDATNLPRSVIFDLLKQAGAECVDSCCGVPEKLCSNDQWKVNMEGLIKAVWRAAQQDMVPTGWSIDRREVGPFHRIDVKSPEGYIAVVDSLDTNPGLILYKLADAILQQGGK